MLQCPSCGRHRIWIVFADIENRRLYRLLSLPGEDETEIPELPGDPPSLRRAYREAMRCIGANCPTAAAAMFRRALQIITRDILGAPPGNLADELKTLKNKKNALGVALTQDFHDNGYILRETGNQAAHPG